MKLKALKVEELKTGGFRVTPIYFGARGRNIILTAQAEKAEVLSAAVHKVVAVARNRLI